MFKVRVAYIPYHAGEDIHHQDVEYGDVVGFSAGNYLVLFDGDNCVKAVIPERLRIVEVP